MTEEVKIQSFDIDKLFNKPTEENTSETKDKEEEKPKDDVSIKSDKHKDVKKPEKEPVNKVKEPAEEDEDEDFEDDEEEVEDKESDKPKDKSADHKAEIEKLQKTLKDTQRSFHEDRKKIAAYKRAVEQMKEDLIISDDEAATLLNHTQFEGELEPIYQEESRLVKYCRVFDNELEIMKKYTKEPEIIDQNIFAFQHLIHSVTHEEREDILDELSQYNDDPIKMTQHMLEIGRVYDEKFFNYIREAGSLSNLITKFQEEKEELQKKLDNARNKINKLKGVDQDYNKEPYQVRQSAGGSNINNKVHKKFSIDDIFNK